MSAPRLDSKLDLESPEAKARAAHNRALAQELRAKVAQAALGGPAASRERHTARGKLLPRERVERLLDPARRSSRSGSSRRTGSTTVKSPARG